MEYWGDSCDTRIIGKNMSENEKKGKKRVLKRESENYNNDNSQSIENPTQTKFIEDFERKWDSEEKTEKSVIYPVRIFRYIKKKK